MSDDTFKVYARGEAPRPDPGPTNEQLDRLTATEAALRLAAAMRDAQRAYFRDGGRERLIASKNAERAFDAALAALQISPSPGQTGRACATPGPGAPMPGPGSEEQLRAEIAKLQAELEIARPWVPKPPIGEVYRSDGEKSVSRPKEHQS